jgi:uncharacterized protein (DUF3820 family)
MPIIVLGMGMVTMNALTDTDLMPFGKYSKAPDGPRIMQDVPAEYLLWLWEEGCNNFGVKKYIEDNLETLKQECPDWIPPDERE